MEKSDGRCGNGFGQPRTRALQPTGEKNSSSKNAPLQVVKNYFPQVWPM